MTCAAGSSPWGPRSTIPKSHQAPSTEHHRQEPQNSAFVYKIEGVDGALFTFPAWKQHKCPTNGLMRSSLSPRRRSQADAWQSQADGCLATPGRPARGHTHTHRERIGQEESVTVFFHHFWRTDRISTLQETLEPLAGPPCQVSPPYHP